MCTECKSSCENKKTANLVALFTLILFTVGTIVMQSVQMLYTSMLIGPINLLHFIGIGFMGGIALISLHLYMVIMCDLCLYLKQRLYLQFMNHQKID